MAIKHVIINNEGSTKYVHQDTGVTNYVLLNGTTTVFNEISGGYLFSNGIDVNGQAWGWGYNNRGTLGNNSTGSTLTPVTVSGVSKVFKKISSGQNHVVALDTTGKAYGWGRNNLGNLGDNTVVCRSTPVAVAGAAKVFCEINSTGLSNAAITNGGKIWCWGYNHVGQLGNNSVVLASTPVAIGGATKTFCKVGSGLYFNIAIDLRGKSWGWGYNNFGQIGNNSILCTSTPVAIGGVAKTFCKIQFGNNAQHTLAINQNGRIYAWGRNEAGQLGTNSVVCQSTPVAIGGATKTFCMVASNLTHSMGLDKNGKIWCWGANDVGQLGVNSTVSYSTPVAILGATKTFCHINIGNFASIAIDRMGRVWTWGKNDFGQLGVNSNTSYSTPVAIIII